MWIICGFCGFLHVAIFKINFWYGFNVVSCGFIINTSNMKTLKPHWSRILEEKICRFLAKTKNYLCTIRENGFISNKLWITFNISKESSQLPILININRFYVTSKYCNRFSFNGDSTIWISLILFKG